MASVEVSWEATGTSYVEISDDELQQAVDAGVDPDDATAVVEFLNTQFEGDILHDAVSDFSERDAPTLTHAEWED